MDSQEIFVVLRNTLAKLYSREEYARVIAVNAGLKVDNIVFSAHDQTNWHNILAEAVLAKRLDALLENALFDYRQNTSLLAAYTQYRQFIEAGGHIEVPGQLPTEVPAQLPADATKTQTNEKHIDILHQGVDVWNQWRQANPNTRPILFKANLKRLDLRRVNFSQSNLVACNLSWANLEKADLSEANLSWANFLGANLVGADLRKAELFRTNFKDADLQKAKLGPVYHEEIVFAGANLGGAIIEKSVGGIGAGSFVGATRPSEGVNDTIGDYRSASQTQIERFPDVSLRSKVALGHDCFLRVALTQQPTLKELVKKAIKLVVPSGADSVTVGILVTAEDFEIVGDDYRLLTAPVDSDSEPLLFQIKPLSLGEKKVKVEFFQNSRYVGGVTVSTMVVMSDKSSSSKQVNIRGVIELSEEFLPPDLTILITESTSQGDETRYRFKLHSPDNNLFFYNIHEELNFSGSPSKWVENLYQELGRLSAEARPEDIKETLSTIGADLYEKLFPSELKEIWEKQIRNRVESIMIISDEPWIPWEIIKPSYENEIGETVEDNFLCESYLLTRWLAGPTPPSRIKISRGALIAPAAFNLPNTVQEAQFLREMGFVSEIEPTLAMVRQVLSSGGYELMHFACHAAFDPEIHEQSSIYLQGKDKLQVRDIAGKRRNFGRNRPFVFINACYTARADFSLVGIGGWASKFINANASGFLGSSWEVNDALAYHFSQAFYQALKDDKPVGQALREARLKIKNSDPTWLAYTLYADPLAKVTFQ